MRDAIDKNAARIPMTLTSDKIPLWQRDNDYIVGGYRRVQNSWRGCFYSVYAYIHNESINIHSHLWGGLLFVVFLATFQSSHLDALPSATWRDTAAIAIFLLSACFCLLASSLFHVSTCHSKGVAASCHALDYSGIIVLTVGSMYSAIYYAFFENSLLQRVYISGITIAGSVAASIVLQPHYVKPSHRGMRTGVFIGLGLAGVVPVLHYIFLYGLKPLVKLGFMWILAAGGLYIVGALIYANRIPERFSPGSFDCFFASHQIFHFFVVSAALCTYRCMLEACYHRHNAHLPDATFSFFGLAWVGSLF